jgi:hypothetical protein
MTLSSRGLFFEIVLEALLSTKRFEFALDHLNFPRQRFDRARSWKSEGLISLVRLAVAHYFSWHVAGPSIKQRRGAVKKKISTTAIVDSAAALVVYRPFSSSDG